MSHLKDGMYACICENVSRGASFTSERILYHLESKALFDAGIDSYDRGINGVRVPRYQFHTDGSLDRVMEMRRVR